MLKNKQNSYEPMKFKRVKLISSYNALVKKVKKDKFCIEKNIFYTLKRRNTLGAYLDKQLI
jgi:hypothetical protein